MNRRPRKTGLVQFGWHICQCCFGFGERGRHACQGDLHGIERATCEIFVRTLPFAFCYNALGIPQQCVFSRFRSMALTDVCRWGHGDELGIRSYQCLAA